MTGFDIKSLVDFKPPKYLCETCNGILFDVTSSYTEIDGSPKYIFKCPVCDQIYFDRDATVRDYFDEKSSLEFGNLLEHSIRLARTVEGMGKKKENRSPIEILLTAMAEAKQFIHFTTWGINSYFVGALKLLGIRISVNGIVSNPKEYVLDELEDKNSPRFRVKIFPGVHPGSYDEMPHQKLIVIDGLIAFKGSANLTLSGWQKAAEGKDLIEVVTNVEEIAKLHNRFFASAWVGSGPFEPVFCSLIPF